MADQIPLKVLASEEVASELERWPEMTVQSRREVEDDSLQMGVKEVIEILAFLHAAWGATEFGIRTLRLLKSRKRKGEKVVLEAPRGGKRIEIYEYEEEEIVRRKVERMVVQSDSTSA